MLTARGDQQVTRGRSRWRSWLVRDEGVTAIEYGLIAALIAVAIIAAVTLVGGGLKETFSSVSGVLPQ